MPFAAHAQQGERIRRIGVLTGLSEDDPQGQALVGAFLQGLQQLGWTDGRNLMIDKRWGGGHADDMRNTQRNWLSLRLTSWSPLAARARRHCSRRAELSRSCSRMALIRSAPASSKVFRNLAEMQPVLCNSTTIEWQMAGTTEADRAGRDAHGDTLGSGHSCRDRPVRCHPGRAPSLGVDLRAINLRDAAEIERTVAAFAAPRMAA